VRSQMQVCSDGGFAVTGYYVIEDPWGGYIDWCGYVMKISSEGELQWADRDTVSFATAPTHESNVVIETSDGGFINGGDGYMIKRDSEGNRLWEQDLDYAITSMCHSHDGNIIVTGGMSEGLCVLRVIDEEGNELFNNDFYYGSNYTVANRIIPTTDGGYSLTGVVSDEVANTDIFICKLNANYDTLWTYRKDGSGDSDRGNWILENSENNLLICGELHIQYTTRGYLVKLDLNGELLYEEILDTEIGYGCWYALDLPDENSFIITAMPNKIKFDYNFNIVWNNEDLLPYYQKIDDGFTFYTGGIYGVHLRKTDENIVSINHDVISINNMNLNCYPNPFNPEVTISFTASEFIENAFINIYNAKGQRVRKLKIENAEEGTWNSEPGVRNVIWNGCDDRGIRMASGIYFVTLNSNGKTLDFMKITMIK